MTAISDPGVWNVAIVVGAVALTVASCILSARRGRRIAVRSMEPLAKMAPAVESAVKKGRPVLFVPGSRDLDNMQTVASLSLLAEIARLVAESRGVLLVPTNRSLVMDTARDVCRKAFAAAGRLDDWNPDWVSYVSDDPLGYVARVEGMIAREKPGVAFLFGSFSSESLLLAEGGHQVGSIQISGTASPVQLPFLVASCDHTLIGEEFFAAGASLGQNNTMLGSVWGQDLCKYAAIALVVAGSLVTTLAATTGWRPAVALTHALSRFLQGGG